MAINLLLSFSLFVVLRLIFSHIPTDQLSILDPIINENVTLGLISTGVLFILFTLAIQVTRKLYYLRGTFSFIGLVLFSIGLAMSITVN